MTNATRDDADFLLANKRFYLEEEDHDMVAVTDRLRGLETLFHRGRQRVFKKLLAKYGAPPYLDAGCGTGMMLRHLPAGSVGIDINPRNLPRARSNAPQANVLQGDLEHLPIRPGSISTVIMTEVLEHFPNPQDVLRHVRALLRPGGRFIGTVPSRSPLWKMRFLSHSPADEPYHKNFRRMEVRTLLSEQFGTVELGLANTSMTIYFVATT
jgi:SAM-dependent methyltransferase